MENQTTDPRFEINTNANLADIGTAAGEALGYLDGNDTALVYECLLDIHSAIYPNASRPATPEENAAIAADEPAADYCGAMGVAGKVLAYLEHLDGLLEQRMDRVCDPGKHQGAFVLDFDTREFISYLLADVTSELLKLQPFQESKKVCNALYGVSFNRGQK